MDKIKGVLSAIMPMYCKSAITKYFLTKYVGAYVTNIDVEKLNLHLREGSLNLKNLELSINPINEKLDQMNLPFILIDGFVGELSLNIPWANIFTENCFLEVNDLKVTLRPKSRLGDVSLVDSMIESMTSSEQMATECVQISEEDFEFSNSHAKHKSKTSESLETNSRNEYETEKIDAIANCAKAIDTIFCKIKIRFNNIMIRIEHISKSSLSGVALEIQISKMDYFDEAGFDKECSQSDQNFDAKNIDSASLCSKKLLIEGISIYTDEFPLEKYSSDESISINKSQEKVNSDTYSEDVTVNEILNNSSDSFNGKYSNKIQENLGNTFLNTSSVLLVKLLYRQEIKIQLRKNDSKQFSGPKINIEMNFGCLISFLTPRQVHLLIKLVNSIISPEKIKSAEITNKKIHDKQKPMNPYDFKAVEDFTEDIPSTVISHALTEQGGWSSPPDVALKDEIFLSFHQGVIKGKPNPMANSAFTDVSDFESSFMSTASTNIYNNHGSKKDDITNFKIRISNVCIVLLHEDILTPSDSAFETVTESSLTEMNKKVDTFFFHLNLESNYESSYQEFLFLKEKSHSACFDSHLRVIISGLLIEASKKIFSNKCELNTDIAANWLEIKECLNESENESPKMSYSDIFSFSKLSSYDNLNCFHLPVKPKLQINIHHCVHSSGRSGRTKTANLDFSIKLDECLTDFDISVIDRLNVLLNVNNVTHRKDLHDEMTTFELGNKADFREMMEEVDSKLETITTFSVKSDLLSIKLFFPIPDLRPVSNINRVPYWKKNVRKEVILIDIANALIKTNLSNANVEILSSDIQFFLQETKEISPVPIMRASSAKDIEKGFNPIRICIKNFPSKNCSDLDSSPVQEQEDMSKSTMGFLAGVNGGSANLFNKRKVAFQNQGNITEITIPSNGKEICQFVRETLKNVQLDIEINLTDVKLILPSKHVYEVIYNRIVSDLLLWTPSAPRYPSKMPSLNTVRDDLSIGTTLIEDSPKPLECKFLCSFKSDCLSECDNDSINHNYCNEKNDKLSGQTFIGLIIKIKNAAGSFHTPYKDEDGKVVPGKYGNISFLFDRGLIFIASGYQGDENAVQGCIMLSTINLYHQPNNTLSHSPTELNSDFILSIKNMNSILYQSDALHKIGGGTAPLLNYKDCFTLCFKSCFDDKRNENLFEVAGTLYNLTLSYFMTNPSESWISQIQDMFNVEDYPVEGYNLPETVTEMNFNFEFCSIDYRPLNLSLKAYITIDSLAISSNLAIKGNTSVITFIVEDAGLFLSKNLPCNKVNLKNDYICVLDIGVLELCMKFDCSSSDIPVTELSISNNVIHIRTCSDSCKALMELLIYFSNRGDLVQEPSVINDNHASHSVIIEPSHTEEMICSQHNPNVLSKHDIVANMMQEAMVEAAISDVKTYKAYQKSITSENDPLDLKVDEFYFPGESKKKNANRLVGLEDSVNTDIIKALREAQLDDSSSIFQSDYKPNDDEEFCVLEDIPGIGIKSPSGKPKAKYIIDQPICIKEGYFDPTTNKPVSDKHKYSPVPICKYNLQEMSIVWHMYGGKDFASGKNDDDDERNGNRQSRSIISNSPHSSPELGSRQIKGLNVTFRNGDASITSDQNSPHSLRASPTTLHRQNANLKWFSLGGSERCHDILMKISLNKIKFKYEMYSDDAPFVSQHCFAINDVVIQDCLVSSKFNKFLYQLSSESFPKQSSSNMIQVKAICKQSDPSFTYESNLSISCRPIRLNIDQDALMFLCQFCDDILKTDRVSQIGLEEKPVTKLSYQPVLSLTCEDTSNLNSTTSFQNSHHKSDSESSDVSHSNSPIYFRSVVFSPDVPIRIDYHGKHIDINSQFGPVAGLIIGLGQLNHSELRLKRIQIKTGVLGIDKLVSCLTNEWLNDIKKNQLPSILGGVGPMHSFVKLGSGIKDLFWLPIEQYHKDGRVIRGLQRGTSAFTSSSAYAILDLTSRFVGTIQSTAETMYDMVSSGPSVKNKAYKAKGQPKDIREGVSAAYGLVRNGLGDTASTLIKVAAEEHSHKGVSGAVGGLLRQIPPSVVQPIIIASEATCTVIGGMTNQLVPEAAKEAAEKWKS